MYGIFKIFQSTYLVSTCTLTDKNKFGVHEQQIGTTESLSLRLSLPNNCKNKERSREAMVCYGILWG